MTRNLEMSLPQVADVELDGFAVTVLAPTDAAVLAGLSALDVSVMQLFGNSQLLGDVVR